ncbi:MAG: hypothetical protein NWR42_13495, partial [Desulfobacterales bacterium]|nr:hypothetical protein [Desulfobacterales bacterium]
FLGNATARNRKKTTQDKKNLQLAVETAWPPAFLGVSMSSHGLSPVGLRLTGLKSAGIHGVELKECCLQFSLLKASTETHLSGFFQNRWRLLYIQFAF